ncbi:helix-turn-helix transcriptional regulator [Micromonospora chersina]|uniref:helix-turn-helix transcriptional regulator n=1 Tax=Micromonospora chersina TaxID=47854 RepID=UPI0034066B9A
MTPSPPPGPRPPDGRLPAARPPDRRPPAARPPDRRPPDRRPPDLRLPATRPPGPRSPDPRSAGPRPLGPLLAELRAAHGWSQRRVAAELCAAAGVPTLTRHEVSRWERQRRLPGDFWCGWLAVVLGVPGDLLAEAAALSRRLDPSGPGALGGPGGSGGPDGRRGRGRDGRGQTPRAARRGGGRARPAATG